MVEDLGVPGSISINSGLELDHFRLAYWDEGFRTIPKNLSCSIDILDRWRGPDLIARIELPLQRAAAAVEGVDRMAVGADDHLGIAVPVDVSNRRGGPDDIPAGVEPSQTR